MCNGNCNQGRRCDCGKPNNFAAFVLIPAMIISGCTAINIHKAPPHDWPKLEMTVTKLGFMELQSVCEASILMQRFACANINFDTMTCKVYYFSDDEYGKLALEHEEMHCLGYDHIGSSELAGWWHNWKQQNRSALK